MDSSAIDKKEKAKSALVEGHKLADKKKIKIRYQSVRPQANGCPAPVCLLPPYRRVPPFRPLSVEILPLLLHIRGHGFLL